jgi:V-type H+-transporting ATPase subunit d
MRLRIVIASLREPSVSVFEPSSTATMAEGMFYNATGGYIEGIVRGYRNALLTSQNYGNLTQCETIDGR